MLKRGDRTKNDGDARGAIVAAERDIGPAVRLVPDFRALGRIAAAGSPTVTWRRTILSSTGSGRNEWPDSEASRVACVAVSS